MAFLFRKKKVRRVTKKRRVKPRKVRRVKPRRKVTKKRVKRRKVRAVKPKKVRKRVKKVKKKVKKPKKVVKPKKVIKPKVKKVKAPVIEKMPDEKALDLVKKYRIPTPVYGFCKNEKTLAQILKKIGYPCVMKVSGKIIHKTDVNGVRTNIKNEEQALENFKQLMKLRGSDKVLIQKQVSGIEMIVGSKWDPQFGSIVTVGLGGIYVEILKDVVFRICPITIREAEDMVKELKGYDILKGIRGARPIKFSSLQETLLKICRLSAAKKIKEMDINPLFVNEEGCWAADVRIVK